MMYCFISWSFLEPWFHFIVFNAHLNNPPIFWQFFNPFQYLLAVFSLAMKCHYRLLHFCWFIDFIIWNSSGIIIWREKLICGFFSTNVNNFFTRIYGKTRGLIENQELCQILQFCWYFQFFSPKNWKLKDLSELNLEWTWFDEPWLGNFEFRWTYPNL